MHHNGLYHIYYFKVKSVTLGKIDWMSTEDQQASSKTIPLCPDLEGEEWWINSKVGQR